MTSALRVLPAGLLLVLAACTQPAPPPSAPATSPSAASPPPATAAHAPPADRMAKVLDLANIDRRIDIFERFAGPPEDAGDAWTRYTIDGCEVQVDLDAQVIRAITVTRAPACHADLGPLLGSGSLPLDANLTFAVFEDRFGQAQYQSPCIDCGNAMDPYVEAYVPGMHVTGFIDFVAVAHDVNELAFAAFHSWDAALRAATPDVPDYVDEGRFNCDRAHDDLGRSAFAHLPVDSISFGRRGDDDYHCDKPAAR